MVNKEISEFFLREHISALSLLPFSLTTVTNERLYREKEGFVPRSVLIFLIPYYVCPTENLSVYAAARDYHLYSSHLYARLCAELSLLFPHGRFYGFTDHSPIDERDAAARAGLGVIGKNRLLLSKQYGSYQFIGEILSDLPTEELGASDATLPSPCIGCDACLHACPTGALRGEGECLSAITQKKGVLSEEEKALLRRVGTVWGCDECQKVCPYTKEALFRKTAVTEIPFFREELILRLDRKTLDAMSDDAFRTRAFAWRGRAVPERNVRIFEKEE